MNTITQNNLTIKNSPAFGMKFLNDTETQKGIQVLKSLGTGREYKEFLKEMKKIKTVDNKDIVIYLHSSTASRNNLYASSIVIPIVPRKSRAATSMIFGDETSSAVESSPAKLSLKSVIGVFNKMKQNLDKQFTNKT